jgi:hypothetical protein
MMELPFGTHKGKTLEEIPEDYLKWLAKPKPYHKPHDIKEITFTVPVLIRAAARKLLYERGWELIGERWENVR